MAGTQKKGFMARFRRLKAEVEPVKANSSKESKKKDNVTSVTKEGVPVVSAASQEPFSISAVRGVEPKSSKTTEKGSKMSRRVKRETVVLAAAPSARDSAFSGPPRYDWIDIVSRKVFLSSSIVCSLLALHCGLKRLMVEVKVTLVWLLGNFFVGNSCARVCRNTYDFSYRSTFYVEHTRLNMNISFYYRNFTHLVSFDRKLLPQ